MKKIGYLFLMAVTALYLTNCNNPKSVEEKTSNLELSEQDEKMKWWDDARFGMFIHFGVYSDLGGVWNGEPVEGYAEHIMRKAKIPLEVYKKEVVANFNPTEFNAGEWVAICKNAGMKYLVITSKHHDGFAMYDSKVTDYDIVDMTPFKRDLIAELKVACDKEGIKFGLYYSHAQDWSHPAGQQNIWDFPGQPTRNRWWNHEPWKSNGWAEKSKAYVKEKAIPQLYEIIDQYDPAIIWFDTQLWLPENLQTEIVKAGRERTNKAIFNSRSAPGYADYLSTTDMPAEFPPKDGYWEAIPTTNHSYGYHSMDHDYKPSSHFIKILTKAAAKGGNLLLNVGPKGNGKINDIDINILKGIGDWLKVNGEAIYGTEKTTLPVNEWGVSTKRDNNLYLHVFKWAENEKLVVGGLKSEVKKVYLLADSQKKALTFSRLNELDVLVDVPANAPDTINTVIVVECKNNIDTDTRRLISTNHSENTFHVFDGDIKGDVLSYGNGHSYDDYVVRWSKSEDYISWNIRLTEKATFELLMSYKAKKISDGNVCQLEIGDQSFTATIMEGIIDNFKLGKIQLEAGDYEMKVTAKTLNGELMNLRNIKLERIVTPY